MKNKVYLAGGLSSNWQESIIKQYSNQFIFFNPREHGLEKNSAAYTAWDLHHVKQCDILFGYMESTNPSGYGLAIEIGFAKALGKTIILVDERSKKDGEFAKRYRMAHEAADIVFASRDEALDCLTTFAQMNVVESIYL